MPVGQLVDWSVNRRTDRQSRPDDDRRHHRRGFQPHRRTARVPAPCRRFAREVIRPIAAKHDREQSVPWEAIKAAREWELHGLDHIHRMGERPRRPAAASSTPRSCTGAAPASRSPSPPPALAAAGIAASGTPEQIGQWVPECYGEGDEIKLGAYAVTEAGAGSDVKSLRTTAKLDGDEWVLNGTKVFISNGGIADVTVVVATVDPELGHRGQASFVVPKDTPGLSQGKKEDKIGIRASQTAEVVLEDCGSRSSTCWAAWTSSTRSSSAPARASPGRRLQRARHLRGHPPAGGRLGARHRAGRLRVDARVPRGQGRGRRAADGAAAHPADAGRRGHRDRGRAPAGLARGLDGPQRRADDRRPGLDVEAQGRRRDDVGHHRR